jgi:protein TonB
MPRQNNATAVISEQNAITQDVRPPKKIKDVAPQYPAVALAAKEQGAVILEASVDARGRVTDTRLLQSIPLLDQAARDAVMQWEYEPTVVDGIPVPATLTVTVNFTLREPENTQ